MAQDIELIVELLREMKRVNNLNSDSFDRLLTNINNRLDVMDRNSASADFIKAYIKEIVQEVDDKYSTTLLKFQDIESALKSLYNNLDEHVKTDDIRELFDIFSKNMNNVYSEARQQKAVLSGIEAKLSEISGNKSDKEDILRTITLLRSDFENLNHSYKNTIDTVNSDLKTILSNVIKSEQAASTSKEQLDIMYKAVSDIITYLNSLDKRDANFEKLLSNAATNESLKLTQGVLDSLIKKSEEISGRVSLLADKADIESLQSAAGIMIKRFDNTVSKELFKQITDKTEIIVNQTDEIKQVLASLSKDIETLPDTSLLESMLQGLFNNLESLRNDLSKANVKENIHEIQSKVETFISELFTIKNIVTDINEVVAEKVLRAINDISFENESYDIKNHVSKMLSMLPQKEDIDRILENNELSKNALDELIKKSDILADRLDSLPTHDDMAALNSNQLSLVENLQDVATKDDIEELSAKSDEIENMIDKLNFDAEFENIYDKTSSIEEWLEKSKIKENSEEVLAQMPAKAEQKDLVEILKTTEKIVSGIEELSNNVDVKKVNRTVAEVYSMIEDLKNDFMNTTEMHHDSVVVQLSELQKSITKLTTAEDFNNFVDGLKSFVETTIENNSEIAANIAEIKNYEEAIIDKLNNINTSAVEEIISKQAVAAGNKLTSLSEYLTNLANTNKNELQSSLAEIIEILQNKKSNFEEIEKISSETFLSIENYLKEIKNVLDTQDSGIGSDLIEKISALEQEIVTQQTSNREILADILNKVIEYRTLLDAEGGYSKRDLDNSFDEISEIKEQIKALGETFNALNYEKDTEEKSVSEFVSEKLNELSSDLENLTNNVENQLQQGFAYNAELVEEKTGALLDFIKDLRHANSENIDLYERLTVADNKLIDFRQELELINTDVISNLNTKTEELIAEIAPIRQMLEEITNTVPQPTGGNVKEHLEAIHDSVQDDLTECTKYSKSTYDKLEDMYQRISLSLTDTENNLRDFILGDIDSVLIKVDNLRTELDDALNRISPPEAEAMGEFRQFVNEINQFKKEQKSLITDTAEDIKSSITDKLSAQHEELKSILAVSLNNEEIISAIDSLKRCFRAKIRELKQVQAETVAASAVQDEFSANQYEQAFELNKNAKIIEEIKEDFNKFSDLVKELSDENPEIQEVLELIKCKMESVSVAKSPDIVPEIIEDDDITDSDDETSPDISNVDFEEDNENEEQEEDVEDDEDDILVGINNFDIVKALDILKQDIQKLHNDVEKVISKDEQKTASATLKSIPTLGNDNLLMSINNKIELLSKAVNRDWLEEIKNYIAGSEIHSMLEEISGKIDILTLSDNNDWVDEIKESLKQLNQGDIATVSDSNKQIQSALNLINEKIDILAAADDYEVIEEVRDALERIEDSSSDDTGKLLNLINEKIDVIAASDNYDDIADIKDTLSAIEEKISSVPAGVPVEKAIDSTDLDDIKDTLSSIEEKISQTPAEKAIDSTDLDDIKYTLLNVDEKVEGVKKLSEADAKITAMLETLNHKIDILSDDETFSSKQDVEDVKHLILAQMDYIEKLDKNNKTDAVKKCLKELTLEVNNLNTTDNTKQIQKTLKDMKESIMAAVVTIFEQVSFVEETEDIKDFVEEKTDEINENLSAVTKQLKQITNADEDPDYTYSMQDIESDLAKLRLALNNAQASEQETQANRLSFILDNINQIGSAVEDLQDSLTRDELFGLKTKFERINTDIKSLNAVTNQLLEKSGESYNALNSGLEGFGKILTDQLGAKVDRVTGMLEKSNASDKVMRQALIYMGEWIDAASESMNKISTNSDEIIEVKSAIDSLKSSIPEQTDILNSIEEKFDEQHQRLMFFEKQISKLGNLEDRFEAQQERIDRLEMSLEKILSAVEEIDDTKVTRKIDKIDKQIAKLSTNIEKLASYVD